MRALVSGGAGFIGSTLVDALLARGDEVVIVDDLSTGREVNVASAMSAGAKLIPADVRDARSLQSIVAVHRPQLVFHLAAQVDVRISVSDPGRDVRVNVEGTVNMLDAAQRAGAQSFVFASSCAVYGDPFNGKRHGSGDGISMDAFPLTEDAKVRPDAPYGQGKLGAEGYVALYRNLHGLHTVSLRFANVYGPRQSPLGESGVVAIFCDRLVNGGRPTIYGDGTQTRDFLFVHDAVAALLAAADSNVGGEFNIGTGVETTVLDVAEKLRKLSGREDFQPNIESANPGEIRRMALASDLAGAELGWQPTVGFDEGLQRTLGGWEPPTGGELRPGGAVEAPSDSPRT
jgi:UDP-glucose 4-epimerase